MHGGLAAGAIANARIVVHRLQRIPELTASPIEAASFNVDAQSGDRGHRIFQAAATTSMTLQVRTRCMSYPDQRELNVWLV